MMPARILVVGTGHLALRIRRLAESRGSTIVHRTRDDLCIASTSAESPFESLTRALNELKPAELSAVFLVDERDDTNIELLIALISVNRELPIVVSLFNENVAPHLQAAHSSIQVLNPARLAAPAFIAALDTPLNHSLRYVAAPRPTPKRAPTDLLMRRLVAAFGVMLAAAVAFFHFAQDLSWLDSLYFVIVTAATVGYGDIQPIAWPVSSRFVDIILILGSTGFIWMIFSLTVDGIIKRRVQLSLGRTKHTQTDHVILCGLGRLGFFIAEHLLAKGEKLLIIEKDESSRTVEHFRSLGADIYVGDARLPSVLADAGVERAKAVYSVTDNDFTNLEIGLNARSFNPEMRLILRIFDETMSRRLKEILDIHLSFSMSALVDEIFLAAIEPPKRETSAQ